MSRKKQRVKTAKKVTNEERGEFKGHPDFSVAKKVK